MHRCFRTVIAVACVLAITVNAAAQPNTAPTKVIITSEHVLSINGKKVFPIGFALPPSPDAKTPDGKPAREELRQAGAIFIRTAPMADVEVSSRWDTEWVEREKQYMKAAAQAGMYCMPALKELVEIDAKHPEIEQRLRRVLRLFKNDPGLGVWKGADEPQWGKIPVSTLVSAYRIIHDEDPNHPIWVVQGRAARSRSCALTNQHTTSAVWMFFR